MEEIVQIMDHHSHAHARPDIVVIAAKVNIIFKNIVHLFFSIFPIFTPEGVLWNRGEALVKFKRRNSMLPAGKLFLNFEVCFKNSVITVAKLSMLKEW
jgi:hypothetical protein